MSIPKVLTIAGSDSGGGAGVQADLKTFSAYRVFGMSVITAVTAQNSLGVQSVEYLPPSLVASQLSSVLDDLGADAAKCGMLGTEGIVQAVADGLRAHGVERLVVDPVMAATSGDALLEPGAVRALTTSLLPLALVVTPNLPEAEILAEMPVSSRTDMEEAARRIHKLGPRHVLVKGGHLKGDAVDILYNGREFTAFQAPRVESDNTHGTGCTFSAAIAASLAKRQPLAEAVRDAKAYVTRAIREGFALGRGAGSLRHFLTEW
jgi:hydroxymethylpyrimidine/phosphomethylpyrimidine kinase